MQAIQLAGITNHNFEPHAGATNRGVPNVFRGIATNILWQAIPEPTIDDLIEETELALQKIISAGLTNINWLVLSELELETIRQLQHQNKLPVRVNIIVPENLMEEALKIETPDSLMLRFGGVIINVDGYLDSKETALNEPYIDDPNNLGRLLYNRQDLISSIKRVSDIGVQPVIVAMGDKAIEITIDAIMQMPESKIRFRVEQTAVLNENLIKRIKEVGIVVSIQPKMISTEFNSWSAKEHLGLERARWLHPIKTLLETGVRMAGGSDCPMEPLNPLLGIQEVVTRESFPEERVDIVQALQLYTINAAYASSEEAFKGSIGEGKLADFTILSVDPADVQNSEIEKIRIEMTIVNGKIFYKN